ncbi:MAG: ectoine/hydroxyectoine ABC transporter permease subunit EhuD [Gammaproteobacteria bacterium]|nr:ectoine/hydroxyectoine ABC transporter permease subunit EhuD [Gammaproteobacteria bacterium]NIR85043.1 ectoine/hydroxyectoine ABC transporter permease subunit EhuD [Gammaproteobacteria bacterium]NIR88310.1 ectoine/hydroxyectoine ABC transporter permease subunit EhuD [Gammaproteobacteria bacterium]NIU06090.1 ectoine/hydroxyectoine ABC transporter permease subunit EhuD [Gammaproteobacteria bacterium]NIV73509.1 ectoine/hydroxyectoine ABC transporter permease subunit EhuD [Gammaproteobacteria ba
MQWDWEFVFRILPDLARGVVVTVQATLLGSVLAMVVGMVIAVARRSPQRWVARPVGRFADFVRGTPLLVQLYFLFFVLPDMGLVLSPLAAGVLGIGLHYSTYTAEVYRAGIENVPSGQWEAAKAVNLTAGQTWIYVIIPQAVPPMIPALANYVVMMFKETPLLSAITVLELMNVARGIANASYRYFEPMTLVGVFFLLVSIPAVVALRRLERRFSRRP